MERMSLATRADEPEVLLRERSGTPILIVDDQSEAQSLLTWSLRRAGVQNPIHCLSDGHEAIRYLGGEPPYCDRINYPLPGVLFLDLKLPVLDGWEVLDWIQGC